MDELLRLALLEDIGSGDATTLSVIPAELQGSAVVFGREPFVLSGSKPFRRIFELLDPEIRMECLFPDGEQIAPNVAVFRIEGRVRTTFDRRANRPEFRPAVVRDCHPDA